MVGGAVNIVTNRPNLDAFDAAVEGSIGNFNSRDLAAFVNVPFADGKVALRIGGGLHQHDGYVDRIVAGKKEGDLDDRDSMSGRIQLRVEPVDRFRVNLTADYAQDRNNGPGNHALFDDGAGGLSGLYTLNSDRDYNNASFDGQQDRDTRGVRAKVEWDLGFATLSYLGSFRNLDYFAFYDFDGSDTPFGVGGIEGGVDEDSDLASNELQLKSLPDSHLTWVVGLYQYRADTTRIAGSYLDVGVALDDIITQDSKTGSSAVYGDITWPVTDKLNIFGGARYTHDEKELVATGESNAPGTFFTNTNYAGAKASDSWGAATWRLGLDYHVTPDVMVYGTVSRGFKSGGYQETPGDAAEAVAPFDPEYITNFEVGFRTQFLDGRLTWNTSLYMADYTDLQVRVPTGVGITTSNAGKARIQGLETELAMDMGGGLELNASYAFTHARFEDYQTIEAGMAVDYSGNRLTRIPDHKFSVSPSWTADMNGAGELKFAVDYVYESRIWDDQSNLPPEIREPTTFIDARVIYSDPSDSWTVSLWGKNLTNEKTRTFTGSFGGVTFGAYNPPTTYGLTLRYDF